MRVVRGKLRKIPQVMAEERITSLGSMVLYERLKVRLVARVTNGH